MDRWLEVVRSALDLKIKYHETAPPGSNEARDLDDAKAAYNLARTLRMSHFDVQHSYMGEVEVRIEFSSYDSTGAISYFMNRRSSDPLDNRNYTGW